MKEFDLDAAMRLYTRRLFAYAYALLCDWHESEDAVQDAFVSAWAARRRFDGENELAWLYAIVRNKCMDRLRRAKPLPLEAAGGEAAPDGAQSRAELITALGRMEPAGRQIVLWRAVEGLGYGEIAKKMHISEAAARKRYERAKGRLASLLDE